MTTAIEAAMVRLRALQARLAGAPEYTAERAAARCPDGPQREHRNAYQAGALEQICRSSADEIASVIRQMEDGAVQRPATAETLTDEQIRDARSSFRDEIEVLIGLVKDCDEMLVFQKRQDVGLPQTLRCDGARERIAAAINARAKAVR